MTQKPVAKDDTDAIQRLVSLVNEYNMSSIDILSEKLDRSEDAVRDLIQSLVDMGKLHGNITNDGERFFRSDTKLSQAPVLSSNNEPIIYRADTTLGKYIFLAGFVMFIIGQALANSGLIGEFGMEIGFGLVICSILVIVVGLMYVSQQSKPKIQFQTKGGKGCTE